MAQVTLANIKRCINFLSFEQKDMETAYVSCQDNIQKKVFFFFSIALVFLNGFALALGIFKGLSAVEIIIRVIVFLTALASLLMRNRFMILQAIAILCVFAFWISYTVIYLRDFIAYHNVDFAYTIGEAVGMVAMIFTLSVKNLRLRFFIQLINIIGKALGYRGRMLADFRILPAMCVYGLVAVGFCMLYDFLDRKNFKEIYESREKLKKFQNLLSNDFPSSIMIMSRDFTSIFFSNSRFSEHFGSLHNENESQMIMNTLFKELILEKTKCDIEIASNKELSLNDFLLGMSEKRFSVSENNVITLFAVYKNHEGVDQSYEIKLRNIVWDNKLSYAIIFNDISDKQTAANLQLINEQKDRVIATVSHELRTPINGIMGLLEMAMMTITNQQALTYLEHCKSCSRLLLYLVNAILDLSQLRHNSLRIVNDYFNVKELLEEVKSLYLFQSHQKKIEFIIDLDLKVPERIYTDKNRLIEILINLLGNAMKFTFEGYVKLIISIDQQSPRKIVFRTEDTGIGIKEEDKPKLFKMFGKITHANRNINKQGAGLGLTIANELVRALNQGDGEEQIQFESEYSKGSSFWFRVDIFNQPEKQTPLQIKTEDSFDILLSSSQFEEYYHEEILNSPTQKLIQYEHSRFYAQRTLTSKNHTKIEKEFSDASFFDSSSRPRPLLSKQILLVDDNPFNLMTASFVLEKLGFCVTKAFNGQECLDLLEESIKQSKKYSLVLTDIQMPLLDGLEMSKILSSRIRSGQMYEIPIIALTANKLGPKEREVYKNCGIVHSLEKPLSVDNVNSVLKKLGLSE